MLGIKGFSNFTIFWMVNKMKSNMCSVAKEGPADDLGNTGKAQDGQSNVSEVENMEQNMENGLVEIHGDIIELETDNGMLVIDNITGHTYGFVGHKTPVLTAIDGKTAFGIKKEMEAHNNGDGVWQGYMDDKDMFRQLVRLGIIYNNNKRWHINQHIVEFVGDEIIQDWNCNGKTLIDLGIDENGNKTHRESNFVGYTETGDTQHAINKQRYLSRKKKENLMRYKETHPAPRGSYFWYKENLVSAEIMEKAEDLNAKEDVDIICLHYKDGSFGTVNLYRVAKHSKKQTDYVWSAKLIYRLVDQGLRNSQRHDTEGQKDCYGKPVNPMVWQPSRAEVYTEITGGDLLNEKIRNSRIKAADPTQAPEPIVTPEEIEARSEDNRRARDNLYRYKQKQAQKAQDDRDELQKLYDEAFDRLWYGK